MFFKEKKKRPVALKHMVTHVKKVSYCFQGKYVRRVTKQPEHRGWHKIINSSFNQEPLSTEGREGLWHQTHWLNFSFEEKHFFLIPFPHLFLFCPSIRDTSNPFAASGGLLTSWCAEQTWHGMYVIWANGKHSHGRDPTEWLKTKAAHKKRKTKWITCVAKTWYQTNRLLSQQNLLLKWKLQPADVNRELICTCVGGWTLIWFAWQRTVDWRGPRSDGWVNEGLILSLLLWSHCNCVHINHSDVIKDILKDTICHWWMTVEY